LTKLHTSAIIVYKLKKGQTMQNLQVHYTYKTKNATVADLCIVQSKTKRFTKTQQLNTQLKLAKLLNLKHFYAVTLTHYSVV